MRDRTQFQANRAAAALCARLGVRVMASSPLGAPHKLERAAPGLVALAHSLLREPHLEDCFVAALLSLQRPDRDALLGHKREQHRLPTLAGSKLLPNLPDHPRPITDHLRPRDLAQLLDRSDHPDARELAKDLRQD